MTFPHDHIQDRYRPEAHSLKRVVLVSVSMITGALGLMLAAA